MEERRKQRALTQVIQRVQLRRTDLFTVITLALSARRLVFFHEILSRFRFAFHTSEKRRYSADIRKFLQANSDFYSESSSSFSLESRDIHDIASAIVTQWRNSPLAQNSNLSLSFARVSSNSYWYGSEIFARRDFVREYASARCLFRNNAINDRR